MSPFIFIILFTYVFARRFAKSIGEPVDMLIEASHKVQAQDLDFAIEYQADNELGRLCRAFDEMKETLKESLLAQWQTQQQHQEMVAALAHDLKTPFTIIQGYAQALLGAIDHRPKAEKYIRVIADNAHRGGQLVQEMLYAAELEDSQPNIPTEFDLPAFLKDKLDVYQGMGEDENISVELELALSEEEPPSVRLDQGKLSRILDNIIMNSLYYTPAGGTITVSARAKGQTLHIAVCDTGPGFTPQDLRHLFEKFYRGDQSRTLERGQSGLGLYIVKQLVEAQGGTVRAYNSSTGGACVEFSIPTTRRNNC
ncbi:MAG: HAMP domain-containing histidine kinase [Firmicutes bacterium]|nr:HAMP domain-containing histidine kinase [Bacillota bacterium]